MCFKWSFSGLLIFTSRNELFSTQRRRIVRTGTELKRYLQSGVIEISSLKTYTGITKPFRSGECYCLVFNQQYLSWFCSASNPRTNRLVSLLKRLITALHLTQRPHIWFKGPAVSYSSSMLTLNPTPTSYERIAGKTGWEIVINSIPPLIGTIEGSQWVGQRSLRTTERSVCWHQYCLSGMKQEERAGRRERRWSGIDYRK